MQPTTTMFCFRNDGVIVSVNAEPPNTVTIKTTFDGYESLKIYFLFLHLPSAIKL